MIREFINSLTNLIFQYLVLVSFLIFCVYVYMSWSAPFAWMFFIGLAVWIYYALKSYYSFNPKPTYDPNEIKSEQQMRWDAEDHQSDNVDDFDFNGLRDHLNRRRD